MVLLHDVGRFFNAFPTFDPILDALFTAYPPSGTILAFIWISTAYGSEKPQVREMVEAYRKIRSSNPY